MQHEHYFTASRIRATPMFGRRPEAEVLHGTYQGQFVALTIIVKGSSWICHPQLGKIQWHRRNRWGGARVSLGRGTPPRHIRKAAKMALRRFLEP